jgi:hypothetical protein
MGRFGEQRRAVDDRHLFPIYTSHLLGSVMQHAGRTSCFPKESQDRRSARETFLSLSPPFCHTSLATNLNIKSYENRVSLAYYTKFTKQLRNAF